jgi:nucleotide-binding universal stress UspA family protein
MSENPVIACYRGLDSADAVTLGARLADVLGEPLVLAAAYRYDPIGRGAAPAATADNERRADAAYAVLQRARRFVPDDIEMREELVPAHGIAEALVDLARSVDASILAVGRDTSGRVTRSLLSRASCPIAVAPLSVPLPRHEPVRRIGVAVDGSTTARWALVAASQLARATGAELVLLSAGPTPEPAAAWLHVAGVSLDAGVEYETRVLAGDPGAALAAESAHLDLLVCGTRGRGRTAGKILGSVSAHLIAHAQSPVIVVPPVVSRSRRGPLGLAFAAA